MTVKLQLTIDCADPAVLAEFWAQALDYALQEPPAGFDSWPAALASWGVPESDWNSANAIVDPAGVGAHLFPARARDEVGQEPAAHRRRRE